MTAFNFYKADKAYGELYFQFPKVFLYSDKYKTLSNDAKIAYMVFKDRLQYSIRNNWIDVENNVYFVYTNNELGDLLNCSEHKVIKIKKELEEKKLLLQVKQGFNAKLKRNEPNRLYLADLLVEAHEVYSYENIGKTLENQGTAKNAVRHSEPQTQQNQGTAKNAVNLYKEKGFKDNKDNKETKYESQNDLLNQSLSGINDNKEEQNELIENLITEYNLIDSYGEGIIRKFKAYSNSNYDTFKVFVDKLYFSHQSVLNETDTPIYLNFNFTEHAEDYKEHLVKTFDRAVRNEKAGKIKTDFNTYLFGAFKKTFIFIGERIEKENDPNHVEIPFIDYSM